ncbi:CU044_5270 family protein [Streptosporangium amethystogenes]|uniref:CU044_5270 family protein n=1 Tax=Streptosporangium amethystogenes TaxID=2002 RepID=UPI000560B5C5|nr:CU044_5270 family protein [Streptosporangium amethystogenes]
MDELKTVRELYGEPRLDPLLKARVRGLLTDEPRRRRWRLSWTAAVAGLAAAAVAMAIAVPGMTGEAEAPNRGATLSGRSVLLAAATTAESGPASANAYWRVRKLHRRTYPEQLGRGANRYWVVESRLTEQWVARDGRVWSASRALGARPGSEADEEAWRRDGSPTEWSSQGEVLSTSPEKGELRAVTGQVPFSMAGHEMTFEQLQRLPVTPAALRDWVTEAVSDVPAGTVDGVVADALSGLLWSKPSPPDVRAAAYRALAELPNIRYLGGATDERGRKGAGFSFTVQPPGARSGTAVQRTLIIDPDSSQVLSSTVTGPPEVRGEQVELVLAAGWTNDRPAVPELP